MRVEVITPSADPDHGGFGVRVHSLVSMFSQFADVNVVVTDWFSGRRVPGVTYEAIPRRETTWTRLQRLRSYYGMKFPRRTPRDPPDLVVVESPELIGLHQYGPGVPLVLDEHNVYWNLLRYDLVNAPFFKTWLGRRGAVRRRLIPRILARAKRFEVEAIRSSAATLVTSDRDREEILVECPDTAPKVRVLPNCLDVREVPPLPDPTRSEEVLFVGDFGYVPNQEAAEFISRTLAPSLPQAQFILAGASPPAWATGPNVVTPGRVPDLVGHLRDAAVCIAPLAHGSGTRIKILTYFAASRPVVATTKAVEGLPVEDGRHLLIRDDPAEFRDAVKGLLENPEERRRLAAAGRELVETQFDWRVHVQTLHDLAIMAAAPISGSDARVPDPA